MYTPKQRETVKEMSNWLDKMKWDIMMLKRNRIIE